MRNRREERSGSLLPFVSSVIEMLGSFTPLTHYEHYTTIKTSDKSHDPPLTLWARLNRHATFTSREYYIFSSMFNYFPLFQKLIPFIAQDIQNGCIDNNNIITHICFRPPDFHTTRFARLLLFSFQLNFIAY